MSAHDIYPMVIGNVARYIRKQTVRENADDSVTITAFQASDILAIAFCKCKEDVLADIMLASARELVYTSPR